jgi:phosphoglycerate kinase
MNKLTLRDLGESDLKGKRVLLRVDYNVPLDERLEITDDTRIQATLPTLELLTKAGARVVILAHFGRPKGKRVPEMSLRPAARRLQELLTDRRVDFVGDTVGGQAEQATRELGDGDVLVLENTRYLPGEEKNDLELARQMAALGDVYVNDAFGAAHRAHSSTAGVAEVMREDGRLAAAGLLMEKELEYLGTVVEEPGRPFVAIIGGAKISGKIDVIQNLLPRVDRLLIGGAMANTFFRAMGLGTGTSLVEEDRVEMAPATSWCSPPTAWWPRRWRRGRRPPWWSATRSLPTARCWTWARAPWRRTARSCPGRRRCSGTGRWACSRSPSSRRGPRAWRAPWRRPPTAGP